MNNLSRINAPVTFCVLISVLLFAGCGVSKDLAYSKVETNQKQVVAKMLNIISNQITSLRSDKRYATAEELDVEKRQVEGYKIEVTTNQKAFQIWATPKEYGKTGKISYYADSTDGDIHGADHQGEKANANDPVVQKILEESKEILRKNQEQN